MLILRRQITDLQVCPSSLVIVITKGDSEHRRHESCLHGGVRTESHAEGYLVPLMIVMRLGKRDIEVGVAFVRSSDLKTLTIFCRDEDAAWFRVMEGLAFAQPPYA